MYRSQCHCVCHTQPEGAVMHCFPCCTPDPVEAPKFPDWQILEAYHLWSVNLDGKIAGQRFGQYFCNMHKVQDNKLFYMGDNKEALIYINQNYRIEEKEV